MKCPYKATLPAEDDAERRQWEAKEEELVGALEQLKREQARKNDMAKQLLVAKDEEIARLKTAPAEEAAAAQAQKPEDPEEAMANQLMDMARVQSHREEEMMTLRQKIVDLGQVIDKKEKVRKEIFFFF